MKSAEINLKKGDLIIVQEPTQMFSHDSYRFIKETENEILVKIENGTERDGEIISFTKKLWSQSKVKKIK